MWSFGCLVASERITRGGCRACRAEKGSPHYVSLHFDATSLDEFRKSQEVTTEAAAGDADEQNLLKV